MDIDKPEYMEYFLQFSAEVTGFSQFELQGTGQAALYFDTIRGVIGGEMFGELLRIFKDKGLELVVTSPKLEQIARNITKLWYMAIWDELPIAWRQQFGANLNNATFVPSPQSYPEGLVWKAIGVNPPGAKAPGYGTWGDPPSVSLS